MSEVKKRKPSESLIVKAISKLTKDLKEVKLLNNEDYKTLETLSAKVKQKYIENL